MGDISAFIGVLSQKRYQAAFSLIFMAFLPILALSSGIIVPSTLEFNAAAEPLRIGLVLLIAALISANGAVMFRNYEQRKKAAGKSSAIGAIAGFFTTACPVCQPAWLIWLGAGSAAGFLADISIYLGIASAALLAVSLHYNQIPKEFGYTCSTEHVHSLKSNPGSCQAKLGVKNTAKT